LYIFSTATVQRSGLADISQVGSINVAGSFALTLRTDNIARGRVLLAHSWVASFISFPFGLEVHGIKHA
jgi:hypothetical protein